MEVDSSRASMNLYTLKMRLVSDHEACRIVLVLEIRVLRQTKISVMSIALGRIARLPILKLVNLRR